jgi:hypothetical protein
MTPEDRKRKDRILGRMLDDVKTGQAAPDAAKRDGAYDELARQLGDFLREPPPAIAVAKLASTETEITMSVELNGFDPSKLSVK